MAYHAHIVQHLDEIDAEAWNALAGDRQPFLRHEFLSTLERTGCLGEKTGWLPWHITLTDDAGHLVAAQPLYLKSNSFGEFVFDWAWADAYHRAGLEYYPKLVSAAPFTPATAPKLLLGSARNGGEMENRLFESAVAAARSLNVSSLHWLFTPDAAFAERHELLTRMGCQFHWHNHGYADFDAFLERLKSRKRKQIRKERAQATEGGIVLERIPGDGIGSKEWKQFAELYRSTFVKYGNYPALTTEFFTDLSKRMGDRILLIRARRHRETVAAAWCLVGRDTLYGRYWGSVDDFPALHFETCYYQGIEYCIEHGLARFEPGAQGEHKVSRGFLPTATWSAHWIADPRFRSAIADFVRREQSHQTVYMEQLRSYSPYKED